MFKKQRTHIYKYTAHLDAWRAYIYETYHSGGIVNIKIKDKSINDWRSVWQAEAGPTHIGIFKENISKY